MDHFISLPDTIPSDLGLLEKITEKNAKSNIHIFNHPSICSRELLSNHYRKRVLILYIEKVEDVEIFSQIKNLISDVPIFIILLSQDPSIRKLCQKLRPKLICHRKSDFSDFVLILSELEKKQ